MDATALLNGRASTPSRLLKSPGPSAPELQALLQSAMRVPDHGKLAPWRFVVVQGDARQKLSDIVVARRKSTEPEVATNALEKDAMRFLHAPVIVVVIASLSPGHKIPEVEQRASASAVCMQLLNAAFAANFGAQWLTGWPAYDAEVAAALGLTANESVSGFIHMGSSDTGSAERTRPDLSVKLSYF